MGYAQQAGAGQITGKVVDAATGDAMIGANVRVEGLPLGAMVDLNGSYTIRNVPVGVHTLVISMIGYAQTRVSGVKVTEGAVARIDVSLQEEVLEVEGITIEASKIRNTEAALLKERQLAPTISDAISAEDISRGGTGDAAAAMTRVTGASVVDGKHVYIRGLGDRYSTAQLNGAMLPSADPNKRSVQMDLFPTNLLDNIVTEKTFTPDKPGNFTGGSVNIGTKGFPERFTMSFSTSSKFNTQTTFEDMLTYPGGDIDFLGYDDGTRDIPDLLADPNVVIPDLLSAQRDPAVAQTLNDISKSFNGVMTPSVKNGMIGQSYSYSLGTALPLFDRPLGISGSMSYNRDISSYDNGISGNWKRVSGSALALNKERLAVDSKSTQDALWGLLFNTSYQPSSTQEVGFNILVNRGGEKYTRFQIGEWPTQLPNKNARYETRVLGFTERDMRSFQLRGKHHLTEVGNTDIEWNSSFIFSKQNEPDLRFFTNDFRVSETPTGIDTIANSYAIRLASYSAPTRYYRNLDENNKDLNLKFTVPFKQWDGLASRLKFGGSYLRTDHTFRERRFEILKDLTRYQNNPQFFFSSANTGILPDSLQTNPRFTRFGNYIEEATLIRNNYDGNQEISAGFLMLELPLHRKLRMITGARFETTRLDVASKDTSLAKGKIDNNDWLPSFNLVYEVVKDVNLRSAYSRTLARPTFRELAPFASFEFVGDFIFVGNENLERTLIDNYDFRVEWFTRPGEIYAVSYFYKKFENPIERVIVTTNGEVQFQNVDEALVTGVEFEMRKKLDQIHPWLSNFRFGGNLSLVKSQVDIAASELAIIRSLDPNAPATRDLQGQSDYVLNLDGSYENVDIGATLSLHYNIFGERLSEVSTGGTPNVFEQPAGVLDFTASQRLWNNVSVKFSGKNLLNPEFKKVHPFNGQAFVRSLFKQGRTFSLGFSYSI